MSEVANAVEDRGRELERLSGLVENLNDDADKILENIRGEQN